MDLFEYLDDKLLTAIHTIESLINHFDSDEEIDRECLILKGGAAFDFVISYIRIEDNLLYPILRNKGILRQEFAAIRAIQREIENIIESSVMMHVDEPSFEFPSNLRALHKQLVRYRHIDQHQIFPVARNTFTTQEMKEIHRNVQHQMNHELKAPEILHTPPY